MIYVNNININITFLYHKTSQPPYGLPPLFIQASILIIPDTANAEKFVLKFRIKSKFCGNNQYLDKISMSLLTYNCCKRVSPLFQPYTLNCLYAVFLKVINNIRIFYVLMPAPNLAMPRTQFGYSTHLIITNIFDTI